MSSVVKETHYLVSPSFTLSKTGRVSHLALLCNYKNDPRGYPNKSLFISVTHWTTSSPFLRLAGLRPHESKPWNVFMKRLTREVLEQPFGSVLRRILWLASPAAAGLSVPAEPLAFWSNAQMQLCVLRPLICIPRASCCWAELICPVCVCLWLKGDMPGEWDGTYLISPKGTGFLSQSSRTLHWLFFKGVTILFPKEKIPSQPNRTEERN